MYASMTDRSRYVEVIMYSGLVILAFYTGIMAIGYYYYGSYTLIPITLNIGKDLQYKDMLHGSTLKDIAAIGTICNLQVRVEMRYI
jgi:hypothetical protein